MSETPSNSSQPDPLLQLLMEDEDASETEILIADEDSSDMDLSPPVSPEARLVMPQAPIVIDDDVPVEPVEPGDVAVEPIPIVENTSPAFVNALSALLGIDVNGNTPSSRLILQNINVMSSMGFSNDLITRTFTAVDNHLDIGLLVNQCLFYDNMGKIPPELLRDVPLERATFIGSRVTSQRHHMTYKVMEFDKDNACVFLVPIIYNRFQWGRGSNRAFWVPMNSHDIHFEMIRHNKPNNVCNDENCKWYAIPPYTVSTKHLDRSLRGKDWNTVRRYMHSPTARSGIFYDLVQMEKQTGMYATISHPVYPEYTNLESYKRYKESILQHMVCICDIHNLSIEELQRIVNERDRDATTALGHGIPELFTHYLSYRSHYVQKHEDWKSRCIPLIKLNVEFDWANDLATINIKLCSKSKHSAFNNTIPLKIAFADVIGRSLSPKIFKKEQTFNNGGQSGRVLTTDASKVTSKFKLKSQLTLKQEILGKLKHHQRRVLDFLVDRATAGIKHGWSFVNVNDRRLMFHNSGYLRFVRLGEDMNSAMATKIPCGAIAVLPPKSGKSTLAALFSMELSMRMKGRYGRTHKSLIVVNKCQRGIIDIMSKFVDKKDFRIIRWRKVVDHVGDLSYAKITHMQVNGCIVVATISQVKSDVRIRHINWDSIVFDDAHKYSSCQAAAAMLHATNLLRKPVCILTQNKEWKVKEFNFYMHMINMPGYHFESHTYARITCNSLWNRDTYIVNMRKAMMRKFCIADYHTVQRGSSKEYDVCTRIVEKSNKDMIDNLYKNQERSGKKSSSVSYVMHAAATDLSIVPVQCFSAIQPEILNGVKVYKQRLADACESLGTKSESSKSTKRKLSDIMSSENPDENCCSICLTAIEKPMLLDCEHVFCTDCIRTNTRVSKKCPLCRKRIHTMKEIDQECQETTQFEGHIIEKDLYSKWKDMKNASDSPKVEELKKIALSKRCISFYSRFSKICTAVSERLQKDKRFKVFNLTSYTSVKMCKKWFADHKEADVHAILVMFPSLRDFPVSISNCDIIVANESFLTKDESSQVITRFVDYNKEPPEIIILKTKGTIDTAGSFFRNNTESGLVSDFFCNIQNMQRKSKDNADILTVSI